jgi:hypothetical protein
MKKIDFEKPHYSGENAKTVAAVLYFALLFFVLALTQNTRVSEAAGIWYDLFFDFSLACGVISITVIVSLPAKTVTRIKWAQSVLYSVPASLIIIFFSYFCSAIYGDDLYYALVASALVCLFTFCIYDLKYLLVFYCATVVMNEVLFFATTGLLKDVFAVYRPWFDFEELGAQRWWFAVFQTFGVFSFVTALRTLLILLIDKLNKMKSERQK